MARHTYELIGWGVDYTGWFKCWLLRDDGKEIKTTRKRVADLRREGRITLANQTDGDIRSCPIDPSAELVIDNDKSILELYIEKFEQLVDNGTERATNTDSSR